MLENRKSKKVNLKMISEITGYSTATISNALNRKKGVNKKTSAEIISTAKELGYIGEDEILKIRIIIFRKNGLIIDDTPFFSLMMDGIEKECRANGLDMLLSQLSQQDDSYVEQLKWILGDNTSAVILLGTELSEQDLKLFKTAKCQLLTLDYWCNDMLFDGITINNIDSSRIAVNYLINKGHTEIGYLRGSFRIKSFSERAQGYRVALHKASLSINADYVITLATSLEKAYQDMMVHLSKNPKIPTAFFADNDIIALGAMRALLETGYRIPGDISIIGFDDLPYSEIAPTPLTTIRVPKQEMGKLAVRKLVENIKDPTAVKVNIQVSTKFIERESVKSIEKKRL